MIFDETTPDTYQDIVFGDSHGKYVVNYDGDWWLTYYIDQNKCYENTGHMCIPSFVKKGNASIIESPVSLDVYRDKEVLVDAITMDPWKWQINSKGKIFCITGDDCKASTGPGYWYMTPVIIKSIKFAK